MLQLIQTRGFSGESQLAVSSSVQICTTTTVLCTEICQNCVFVFLVLFWFAFQTYFDGSPGYASALSLAQ